MSQRRSPALARVRRRKISPIRRSGLAAVELALCLPVMLTTALGLIETSNLMCVQSRIQSVAYEGARIATRPATATADVLTDSQVISACNTLLTQLGVTGATVQVSTTTLVSPSSSNNYLALTGKQVSVTAPLSQNSTTFFVLKSSLTISANATLPIVQYPN